MRTLGVDLGDVRIGLAVSDPDGLVATPLETIPAGDVGDAERLGRCLAEIAERERAGRVVIGLPRALSGREGQPAQHARAVAEHVGDAGDLEVELWDERFSTVEAERSMLEGGTGRRERRQAVDRVAATLILQAFLDAQRSGGAADAAGGEDT